MTTIVLSFALAAALLHHYVFSFQRFTLAIARRHAASASDIGELQVLMTPVGMGALAGLSTISHIGAAVAIGFVFAWWWGVIYFAFDQIVVGGFVPLFRPRHFRSMVRDALARASGQRGAVAIPLLLEVIASDVQEQQGPGAPPSC